jgi:hypothetical protein
MMNKIEPWGIWHSHALAAGVSTELASLGRAVIRNFWQNCRDEVRVDNGSRLGADKHHVMMIAFAKRQPSIAKACFEAAGEQDDEEMKAVVKMIEARYAADGFENLKHEHIHHLFGAVIAN